MKGRPILGAISGLVFGILLGPTLWLWGVIDLASPLMWILPIVGLALGLLMAAWAPFGTATETPAPAGPAAVPDLEDDASDSTDAVEESAPADLTEEE
jgi:hypothetical protein